MFCQNCGGQLDDSAKFCEYCGQEVNSAPEEKPYQATAEGPVVGPEPVITVYQKPNYQNPEPPASRWNAERSNPDVKEKLERQKLANANKKASTALGSSIGSILLSIVSIFIFGWLSIVAIGLAVTAISSGSSAMRVEGANKTPAVIGIILGVIGLILAIVMVLLWILTLAGLLASIF